MVEIDVPTAQDLGDYARRINEAIEILALAERRSPAAVLISLATPSADVLRFRFTGEGIADGTIPLDDAIRLREARRQLLLSVAHSVVEPLAHFPRLSRAAPGEFIASCRELPTERGSYVSSVVVPISPEIGKLDLEPPFARRVTERLANAVSITADLVSKGEDDELLGHAVEGVSSNFLSALSNLTPPDERGSLEIGFGWSPNRAVPSGVAERITLPMSSFTPLAAAAQVLRESTPVPGCQLEGYVVRLERDGNVQNQPGQITLVTSLGDGPETSKVRIELGPAAYQRAVDAHSRGDRVRITGTLERLGRTRVLSEPSGLTVVRDEEE